MSGMSKTGLNFGVCGEENIAREKRVSSSDRIVKI
jgi:hypothetical protein